MFIRLALTLVSTFIIFLASWLQFVTPIKKTISINDSYPGTISSEIITTNKIYPQGRQDIEGDFLLIKDGEDTYVRIENFKYKPKIPACANIQVVLSDDLSANYNLVLGDLKGTEGSMNYILPKKEDYKDYAYLMIWCKSFRTDYGHGDLIEKINKPLFLR